MGGLYDALAAGDVPAVLGASDPNIRWEEVEDSFCADGNPLVGQESVLAGVFQPHLETVENFAATPHNVVDGGDMVVVVDRYTGTVKAIGVPINAQFGHYWDVKDGKVVRFQQYTDTKQWADAVSI